MLMLWSVLVVAGLIYFGGMMVALAFAMDDLDEMWAASDRRHAMSDVVIMSLGYMLMRMLLWPCYAYLYVRAWLRARAVEERP